jgi:hypothetical protein
MLLSSCVLSIQIGPLRCWPGDLCLSRSIGDQDVGEFIIPVPYVKQIKVQCWEVVLHHFRTKLNCKLSL